MKQLANAVGRVLCGVTLTGVASVACHEPSVTLRPPGPPLVVHRPALYPETIEYDRTGKRFLLSSFRDGAIYAVNHDGSASALVNDPRLCSVLGIALDVPRRRIWAANSDLGASARPSAAGPKQLATVGVYDLSTGRALDYVDLTSLLPGPHLLNGIAVDSAGNAYVSDSFAPALYRIDAAGHASVFLRSDQFLGEGINLNGLAVHPGGYLLVIKKSDGILFKVPLAEPERFSKVRTDRTFVGGDGLTLTGPRSLVVIANQTPKKASNAAFSLASDDDWVSANLVAEQSLDDTYPTTAVIRDHALYVVSSKLNELIAAPAERQKTLHVEATIRQIGTVTP
jgi:sugar lactone lactonase YvrE